MRSEQVSSKKFKTLYIGGGTPSLLSPKQLESLLQIVLSLFKWYDNLEATIEINPDSVSLDWMNICKNLGINRISIGMQSLSNTGLKTLGRLHDVKQSLKAYDMARKIGFNSVSIDIIYGWPGQTMQSIKNELQRLVHLFPDHISCYQLIFEPGTSFWQMYENGLIVTLDEDTIVQLTDYIEYFLIEHGYLLYEISNFAKPGFECIHNLNYWENGEYLGFGCAAVSYLNGERIANIVDLKQYIEMIDKKHLPIASVERLDKYGRFRETIMLGLRCVKGIDILKLEKEFQINPIEYYGEQLATLLAHNFLAISENRLFFTKKGRRVANQVLIHLI